MTCEGDGEMKMMTMIMRMMMMMTIMFRESCAFIKGTPGYIFPPLQC